MKSSQKQEEIISQSKQILQRSQNYVLKNFVFKNEDEQNQVFSQLKEDESLVQSQFKNNTYESENQIQGKTNLEISQGEINIQQKISEWEQEIQEESKKKQSDKNVLSDPKMIRLDKIAPVIAQLQTVSHHNLFVAQNYMLKAQHLEEILQNVQNELSFKSDQLQKLQEVYDSMISNSNQDLNAILNEKAILEQQNNALQITSQQLESFLQEKNKLIHEKNQFIEQLKEDHNLKMNSLANQCDQIKQRLVQVEQENQDLDQELKRVKNEFSSKEKIISSALVEQTKYMEELRGRALAYENQVKQSEGNYIQKSTLFEEKSKQLTETQKELKEKSFQLDEEKRKFNEVLQQKNTMFENFNDKLREQVQSNIEKYSDKLAKLENTVNVQNDLLNERDNIITDLKLQLTKTQGELQFSFEQQNDLQQKLDSLLKNQQEFELQHHNMIKSYEQLIDNIQNDLTKSKAETWKLKQDNFSIMNQLSFFREKETMLDLMNKYKKDSQLTSLVENVIQEYKQPSSKIKHDLTGKMTNEEYEQIKQKAKNEYEEVKKVLEQVKESEKKRKFNSQIFNEFNEDIKNQQQPSSMQKDFIAEHSPQGFSSSKNQVSLLQKHHQNLQQEEKFLNKQGEEDQHEKQWNDLFNQLQNFDSGQTKEYINNLVDDIEKRIYKKEIV